MLKVVEDVAIRGHQRFLSEQVHLERCLDSSCHINLNVSMCRRECHCWELRVTDKIGAVSRRKFRRAMPGDSSAVRGQLKRNSIGS